MSNLKEDAVKKAMLIFAETEKRLLDMLLSTEQAGAVELLHPFYFERIMGYFHKHIPEQTGVVYPLFFTEIETIPQLKEVLITAMKTVLLNAKNNMKSSLNLDETRDILKENGFQRIHVDNLLRDKSDFIWDEIIQETDKLMDSVLESVRGFSKVTIEMNEIKEVEKELPQLSSEQRIIYLANTKSMYLFLTYMNEVAGRKEFFDYIATNLIGNIMFDERNRKFADKIVIQINSFLANTDRDSKVIH